MCGNGCIALGYKFMKFYEGPVIPYYIKGYTIKCGPYRYKWINPYFLLNVH